MVTRVGLKVDQIGPNETYLRLIQIRLQYIRLREQNLLKSDLKKSDMDLSNLGPNVKFVYHSLFAFIR